MSIAGTVCVPNLVKGTLSVGCATFTPRYLSLNYPARELARYRGSRGNPNLDVSIGYAHENVARIRKPESSVNQCQPKLHAIVHTG